MTKKEESGKMHKAIKMLRLYHGLTATEMAEKLGIYSSKLSAYERNVFPIPMEVVKQYGVAFDMLTSDIVMFAEKLEMKGLEKAIIKGIKQTIKDF